MELLKLGDEMTHQFKRGREGKKEIGRERKRESQRGRDKIEMQAKREGVS